jgi:hypothetical protein
MAEQAPIKGTFGVGCDIFVFTPKLLSTCNPDHQDILGQYVVALLVLHVAASSNIGEARWFKRVNAYTVGMSKVQRNGRVVEMNWT